MKVEIRNNSVLIDGYVNAVERDSKVLEDRQGKFIEKIKAGAFQRALDYNKKTGYSTKVLFNHDWNRKLTDTSESTTNIREDAVGLRCTCEIRDAEVVQKAKDGKLVGWSFGFVPQRTSYAKGDVCHREIRALDLREVSILDDTKIPAYDGTSIEAREGDENLIEYRLFDDKVNTEDHTEKEIPDLHKWENRYNELRVNRHF